MQGESWLLHHGFAQAEGVANLDKVAAAGCLVEMGFPKIGGGLGGFARFIAICLARVALRRQHRTAPGPPLQRYPTPLDWDPRAGMRVR